MSYAGWLQKRSAESFTSSESHGSSILNRYCVLCGPFLLDFSDKESFLGGIAPKREAEVIGVAPWDENKNKVTSTMFVVMTKFGGPIVCTTSDPTQGEEWIESIQQVLSLTMGSSLEQQLELPWRPSLAKMQHEYAMDAPPPLETDTCQKTGATFMISLLRYNCVNCGGAFCYDACSREIPLLQFGFESPKRVCDDCYLAQLLILHAKLMFYTLENSVLQRKLLSKGLMSSTTALVKKYFSKRKLNSSLVNGMRLLEKQIISLNEYRKLYITEEKHTWDEAANSIESICESLMARMSGDATLGLIKLLHDSAQSEEFTVEQFYQVIQQLHLVADDNLDTIGFYWPQLIHTHYLMVPMFSGEGILKAELLEDFILSMCRKSAHLAVKLIWLVNGNLEDMASFSSSSGGVSSDGDFVYDTIGKKVNLIRLAIEVEDAMLSAAREEGADASLLNHGVLKSLINPTGAQSSLLGDHIFLLRTIREATAREFGIKFHVKTSILHSPLPNDHKEITRTKQERAVKNRTISPFTKDEQFSSSSFLAISHTSTAKAFYFESQLEFVKAIVGIAETLRFVELLNSNARALRLKSEIHTVLEGDGNPSKRLPGFVPVCTVSGKIQPIVRVPEDEGHVFKTKARAPTLYVFEVLGDLDNTMSSDYGTAEGGGENGGYVIEGGTELLADVVSEMSLHEVDEDAGVVLSDSSSITTCQSGSSNDDNGGYDKPPHSEVVVAAAASLPSLQEDVSILEHKNGEMEMLSSNYQQQPQQQKQQQLRADLSTISSVRTEEEVGDGSVCHHHFLDNWRDVLISDSAMYPAVFLALHFLGSSNLDETLILSGHLEKVASVEFFIASNASISMGNGDGNDHNNNDLERGGSSTSPVSQPADNNAYNPSLNRTEEPSTCDKKKNCVVSSSIHDGGSQSSAERKWGRKTTTTEDILNMIKYVIASIHSYSDHALMRMVRPESRNGMAPHTLSALEFGQLERTHSSSGSSSVMDQGSGTESGGGLSPAVLQARDLYKEGLITAEELQTVQVKDSAFLELIEEHAFLDTQFCVNLAFGENWASKRSRIREASPFGSLPGWDLISLIAKSNDDLRQEVCALQLIQLFQHGFEEAGLDVLWLKPYQIISTGARTGLVQTLTDTQSLDGLKKRDGFINLRNHFEKTYSGTGRQLKEAQRNFLRSLAAYSLICYILQVKDRHNGNILLSSDGHIIHIDFGWLLGIAPGGSFSLESSPFKLTAEYIDVLGGLESEFFFEFVVLFTTGMLVLQAAHERIVGLVEMLIDRSPYPCFQRRDKSSIISQLRTRLMPNIGHHETVGMCLNLIRESMNSVGTAQVNENDAIIHTTIIPGLYPHQC